MSISNEFLRHLFTYGRLRIPEIGELYLRQIPAKKANFESKLYGPSVIIEFDDQVKDSKSDISIILQKKYKWSEKKAERKLYKSGIGIFNQLLNIKRAEIKGLGTFIMDPDGKVKFKADKDLIRVIEMQFPDVPIRFINPVKKDIQKTEPSTYLEAGPYEKEQKLGWFFPLLALVATSMLLACLVSCFFQKNGQNLFGVTNKQNTVIILDTTRIDQGENTSVLEEEVEIDSSDSLKDSLTAPVVDHDSTSTNDGDSEENEPFADTLEQESSGPEDDIQAKDFDNIENLSLDHLLQKSAEKRLLTNKACMIVVGSYQRRDLLDAMINQLNDKSLDIYIEKYGTFYRTCILFDCNEKNEQAFLNQIRTEIEPAAWLLKY